MGEQCACGHDQTRHNHLVGVGYVGRCLAPMCPCMSWREPKPSPIPALERAVLDAAKAFVAPLDDDARDSDCFFCDCRRCRAIDLATDALEAAESAARSGEGE